MNWIAEHQREIIALGIALICISTAKKGLPKVERSKKKGREGFARWCAFVLYAIGGFSLAVAAVPNITAGIAKLGTIGGLAAIVGNLSAILLVALGWQGVAMTVSVIRDLFDKIPDKEARAGALWIPTLLPIGGAAVAGILQNPQGLGQGLTAAVMGLITLVYVFMIVKRMDAAQTQSHKNIWNWAALGVCVIGGLVLVPLIAYTDTTLAKFLPSELMTIARIFVGLSGLGALFAAAYDLWCDGEPGKLARTGAVYGLGVTMVFGGIALAVMTGTASDGAGVLGVVFN